MILYILMTALTIGLAWLVVSEPCRAKAPQGSGGLQDSVAPGLVQTQKRSPAAGGLNRRQAFNLVCLTGIFLVLAGVSALRLEVGNDYGKYVDIFHEIHAGTDGAYVVTEAGFNFVVGAVYTLSGFENYLLVFAIFGAATAFVFLKAMYDQSVDFKISFAMFMLLGLYFRTFTTVRYYFVLALTLYSLRYVQRKEFGKFLLLILFAALFHKSVLVVLVLYPLAHVRWNRGVMIFGTVAAAAVFVLQKPILQLALLLYPTFEDTVYLSQGIGLLANASGILRCLFVFGLALLCRKESLEGDGMLQRQNRFYLKLSVFGFLLYTCGSFLPLVSRIAYYVVTPQILLVPGLLFGVKDEKKKKLVFLLAAIFCLLYFAYFLKTASGSGIRVLPYKTWIFHEKEWINGSDFF